MNRIQSKMQSMENLLHFFGPPVIRRQKELSSRAETLAAERMGRNVHFANRFPPDRTQSICVCYAKPIDTSPLFPIRFEWQRTKWCDKKINSNERAVYLSIRWSCLRSANRSGTPESHCVLFFIFGDRVPLRRQKLIYRNIWIQKTLFVFFFHRFVVAAWVFAIGIAPFTAPPR